MPLFTPFKHWLPVIAVLLLALALRVAAIDRIPAGLSHDEAYNGVTAIQTLEGDYRIFYEINKGIEPLIIYLEAAAFYFFGVGPVPLRLVNIFAGMLTVALVYPLAARLFNRRVALLAMAGVAVSFWAVFVSRLTLRAVLLPPLLLLTLYLFWRGLNPKNQSPKTGLLFFSLSGLAAGLTMYTYLSSRFVPLIIVTLFGYQLLRRQINRWHWLGLLLHLTIWAAVFTPLAAYFWQNSASFTRRSGQVTHIPQILEGDFQPVIRDTLRTLGMFTFTGDTTDRYNLDGRPVFDWLNGLLFYAGVGLVGWRLLRSPKISGPEALLASAIFFMLLPDFITDDSPHFLRTIGAMPFVYIIWALGVVFGFSLAGRGGFLAHRLVAPLAITLLLAFTALHTGYDYFGRWANAPNGRYIYGADIAELAQYLKANYGQNLTVISAEYYRDLDPFRLRLHFQGDPPFVIWFDGQQTLAFPPPESNLSPRYAFAGSAPPAAAWTLFLQPIPAESGREYTLYRLADESPFDRLAETMSRLGVVVNNDLVILGYQIDGNFNSRGKFQVLLGWQALRALPPGTDYTFLVTMKDDSGRAWLQVDGNGYAPADWQPGVQALQLLTFRLPADLPPGAYHLGLAVVDRRRGQALPTATGAGEISLGRVIIDAALSQ